MMNSGKITLLRHNHSKARCDKCGKEFPVRNIIRFHGEELCFQCRQKLPSSRFQQSACQIGKPHLSLDEALNKVYEIKTYFWNGYLHCIIPVSSILSGKKVRLVLAGGDSE